MNSAVTEAHPSLVTEAQPSLVTEAQPSLVTEAQPSFHVYYGYAHEGGCSGGDGRGELFFTEEEIPFETLETMSENGREIEWRYCGILEPGMRLYYDIHSANGYSCCSGFSYYNDFYFTREVNPMYAEKLSLCDEYGSYVDDYRDECIRPYVITYDEASHMRVAISNLFEMENWA
jgi:hypothetical protein